MFKLQERFLHGCPSDGEEYLVWRTINSSYDIEELEEHMCELREYFEGDYEYRIVGEEE